MKQIECKDICLGYNKKQVVGGISFKVNQGDYLCILGDNGTGKSTLVKALLDLQRPLRGEIRYCNAISARDIGYMPQKTDIQKDFPASVKEIVLSGTINRMKFLRPFYSKKERARAEKAMQNMGILEISEKCYRELSGGQQQRVLLARALCSATKILILDEPTQGLDEKTQTELYELISELNRKENITIIMVSHDTRIVLNHATHILHIGHDSVFWGTKELYEGMVI